LTGKNYTPEQIIRKLREGEGLIASGMSIDQVTKQLSVGLSTWHRRKAARSFHLKLEHLCPLANKALRI